MRGWTLALYALLAPACVRASGPAGLFPSEDAALSSIAELGGPWRAQTSPPQTLTPYDWISRFRRFFFADGRSVNLKWSRAGALARVDLADRECWRNDLDRTLGILVRLTAADPGKLRLMSGAAARVFYRGFEPALRVQAGDHLIFEFYRTSARYSCQIHMMTDR